VSFGRLPSGFYQSFRSQPPNGSSGGLAKVIHNSSPHPVYLDISVSICPNLYINIYFYICCRFKQNTEARAIFFYLFTIVSLCKQKFVVCLFVCLRRNERNFYFCKQTNRTCPPVSVLFGGVADPEPQGFFVFTSESGIIFSGSGPDQRREFFKYIIT
jgi:hypothetical protein